MCGIFGWILNARHTSTEAQLKALTDSLRHRGPDGGGYWFGYTTDRNTQIALGHRRLSIIDLEGGAQPMLSKDKQIVVVFNGEIYNFIELREELRALGHNFETSSDTEVVIQAYLQWGKLFFGRLRGMFAFVLLDQRTQQVVLGRDPFGKKPLYYAQNDKGLSFGSEIGCLLAAPHVSCELDWDALAELMVDRYVPGPATLFRSVKKLPPGSYGVWSEGRFEITRYFQPPLATTMPDVSSYDEAVTMLTEVLEESVRIRMRSDAPFGAYLSGGLDSSAVVALMSRHSKAAVRTFSVGFQEAAYSELDYARTVARHFNTDHQELEITAENYMASWSEALEHRGAPVSEPADIPILLLSKAARGSVKMVLTGEGADEILGGYPKYRAEQWTASYQRLVPQAIHEGLLLPIIESLPYSMRRIKLLAKAFSERDVNRRLRTWFGGLSISERDGILLKSTTKLARPDVLPDDQLSPLRRALLLDQKTWLPDNLLERGDRMMMAGSIEGRMPFMDVELARTVARFPDHFLMAHPQGKAVLRTAVKTWLPKRIIERKKVGFRIPINEWFRGPFKEILGDLLMSGSSELRQVFDSAVVDRYVTEHVNGRRNHEKIIWMLVNLELFFRKFKPSFNA